MTPTGPVHLRDSSWPTGCTYNLAYFHPDEKDTDSGLNTFSDRSGQNVVLANAYLRDFIFPGYTVQTSLAYNHDPASVHYNTNSVQVRPDPVWASLRLTRST